MDLLSPRGKLFGTHQRRTKEWAYRGHGDEAFKLIPKALRQHECEKLFQLADCPVPTVSDNQSQLKAEVTLLEQFINNCNERGLVVPGYGIGMDEALRDNTQWIKVGTETPVNWPHPPVIPALCLAQHHGLPTRLLDWSYSGFKAAYFAAIDSTKLKDACQSPNLSVWAVRLTALACLPPISVAQNHARVGIINPPRCDNAYLHAQDGLFTVCRIHAFEDSDLPDRRSLDEQIEAYEIPNPYGFKDFPVLYHLTLKHTEAPACLRGLEQESVTASTLFPDYGGVAKAMLDALAFRY